MQINPVPYGDTAVMAARFSQVVPGRSVWLQRRTDAGWTEVASGELDGNGRVEFHPPAAGGSYRAVVAADDSDGLSLKATATPVTSAQEQWRSVFSDDFTGSSLSSRWSVRLPGVYYPSRWCSASYPSMVSVGGGVVGLKVAKASSARTASVRANAAAKTGVKPAKACPHGVYDNAMISTEGRFTLAHGTVAVRAKFPYQRGMHPAAWLQTPSGKGVEIDFIETFGYQSKGLQNMLHPKSAKGSRLDVGGYVTDKVPAARTRQWWDQYHVASVEWTPQGYVFRLDGVVTFRTSKASSSQATFLALSLLSADYETDRLHPDQLPATFQVDWIRAWRSR